MGIRQLFTAIFCAFSFFSYAGHELGGVIITYESAQQLNNNPLEYTINVYMFFDKSGPISTPPSTTTIQQTSSCYSNASHSLALVSNSSGGFLPLIGSDYCSGGNNLQNTIGMAHYRGNVVLPGTCLNFKFSVTSGFGRYNSCTNMAYNFNNNYFEIKLNNVPGPNSSPTLAVADFIKAACLNKPLNLYNFSESDGDSVYYAPGTPLISPSTQLSYATGFNALNQVNSSSGFSINHLTGLLQTQLGQVGQFVITINYAEYRKNSSQQNVLVGGGQFSVLLFGSATCSSAPFDMIHVPVPNADSLGCATNSVKVATTRKIATATLTSSGSEFTVLSKRQGNMTVSGATVLNDSVIELSFTQTIPGGDTLEVIAKNGTDGNVLLSTCGKPLLANADTIRFFSPAAGVLSAGFGYSSNVLSASFNSGPSTGNISTFEWDFGDGSPSGYGPVPNHTYSAPGLYNVRLIISNICGISDTTFQSVRVCDSLLPAFSFTQIGDSVSFDAGNTVGASGFSWDFGDGVTGSGAMVNHTYAPGNYRVTLIATNLCGDTVVISDSVETCQAPAAGWNYTIVSNTSSGMKVDFDGTQSTNVHHFLWDFGDGNTDNTTLTPTHTYITPSLNYFVSLTVYNDCDDPNVRAFRLNQIGIEELPNDLSFSFYPNPAADRLDVEFSQIPAQGGVLSIYSAGGKVVLKKEVSKNPKTELDISHLPQGIYFLELERDKSQGIRKFVIAR